MSRKLADRKRRKLEELLRNSKTVEILRFVKKEKRILSEIQKKIGGSYETLYDRIEKLIDMNLIEAKDEPEIGRKDSDVLSITENGQEVIEKWNEMINAGVETQ